MANTKTSYQVPNDLAGLRLDKAIAVLEQVSRATAMALIDAGTTVDGLAQPGKYTVSAGQVIQLAALPAASPQLVTIDNPEICYEDASCVVINKPAGVIVHPASHWSEPSLAGFASTISSDEDNLRPGIVHRLDRLTSGLVVVAKTTAAKLALQGQFRTRRVHKTYLALVQGSPEEPEALLDWPIGRHPKRPTLRAVRPDGKPSRTRYRVLESLGGYTLLELHPETGRTHQIRVHLARLGHPIVGDTDYAPGRPTLGLARYFLHATRLQFSSPSGAEVDVTCPLPAELETVLAMLRGTHA